MVWSVTLLADGVQGVNATKSTWLVDGPERGRKRHLLVDLHVKSMIALGVAHGERWSLVRFVTGAAAKASLTLLTPTVATRRVWLKALGSGL